MKTSYVALPVGGHVTLNRANLLKAAFLSPICQVGGLIVGIVAGTVVHGMLPGHSELDGQRVLPAAVVALTGFLGGGMVWGVLFARLAGSSENKRAAGAGATWAVLTITLMLVMQVLEPALVAQGALALHYLYTLLFIPAIFMVCFGTAWAMAVALRRREWAWRTALITALTGALMFLVINVVMDVLGWRVGAPRAAERFTMLTVTLVCTLATSAVSGAMLVAMLWSDETRATHQPA